MSTPVRQLAREGWSASSIREITVSQWLLWFGDEGLAAGEQRSSGSFSSIAEAIIVMRERKKQREAAAQKGA